MTNRERALGDVLEVVVEMISAGLVESDGQALALAEQSLGDAVVGRVVLVGAEGDQFQDFIGVGDSQRVT